MIMPATSHPLLLTLLLALLSAAASANVVSVTCPSRAIRAGGEYADVTVNGSCTLTRVTVYGTVMVESGSLSVRGSTLTGGLQVASANLIDIDSSTSIGDVAIENAGRVNIGPTAALDGVSITDSGPVTVRGRLGALSVARTGTLTLRGAAIFPRGLSLEESGLLVACGSNIGIEPGAEDGGGGLSVSDSREIRLVADSQCAPNRVGGSIYIQGGRGPVRLVGTPDAPVIAGDFSVIGRPHDVELRHVSLSDVALEGVGRAGGLILFDNVVTDSDTGMSDTVGNITITQSAFGSDASISLNSNGVIRLLRNSFDGEGVGISGNGMVVIEDNADMDLNIIENSMVSIHRNRLGAVEVSKNGVVEIFDNAGEALSCTDNQTLTGAGNEFGFVDGQCSGI